MTDTSMTDNQAEALSRAQYGSSVANYPAIFEGFGAKGIASEDIRPRVNIFTFNAWKAQGRVVRRGEHGVKVTTWVTMTKRGEDGTKGAGFRRPKMTTVFHISQTEPLDTGDDGHAAGARAMSEEMCGQ